MCKLFKDECCRHNPTAKATGDKQFELESHLHEQFAINNNAHTTSFISFVVALFVLFGAFGYVFVHTISAWSVTEYTSLQQADSEYVLLPVQCNGHEFAIPQKDLYTLDQFLWAAGVVSGVLCFLACLSLQIGYAQRRDQIVVQKIRENHSLRTVYEDATNKNKSSYIPDYYNLFFILFIIAQIAVLIACQLKLCGSYDQQHFIGSLILLIIQIAGIIISFCRKCCLFGKYHKFVKKVNESSI